MNGLRIAALAWLVPWFAAPAAAGPETGGSRDLYALARRASIEVLVDGHLAGSGWFADPAGLALTASHVLDGARKRIEILSPVAGRMEARLEAVDRGHDLALLRVPPREGGFPALRVADRMPPPAAPIFLLGAPIYRHAVLLRGWVARDGTTFEYLADKGFYAEVYHVCAPTPPGMSGGPWLDARGAVVGLQSGMMREGKAPSGIAFVAPADAIRGLLASRRAAATPTLGVAVEEIWEQDAKYLRRFPPGTEGLVVRRLAPEGPAARAGLRGWDLVVAADGQRLRWRDELLRLVRSRKPGEVVRLAVRRRRDAESETVAVRIGRLEGGRESLERAGPHGASVPPARTGFRRARAPLGEGRGLPRVPGARRSRQAADPLRGPRGREDKAIGLLDGMGGENGKDAREISFPPRLCPRPGHPGTRGTRRPGPCVCP